MLRSTMSTIMPSSGHKKSSSFSADKASVLLNFDPLLQRESSTGAWSSSTHTGVSKGLPPRAKTGHRSHVSLGSADLSGIFLDDIPRRQIPDAELESLAEATVQFAAKNDKKEANARKKIHRKSHSLISFMDFNKLMGTNPSTPHISPILTRPTKSLTPTKMLRGHSTSGTISPCPASRVDMLQLPLMAKPSPMSFLTGAHDPNMRTSEQDPAPHQTELPTAELLHTNVTFCTLMDTYRSMDPTFHFSMLAGVSSFALKEFAVTGKNTVETAAFTEQHRPIVKALLECEKRVTVEGYAAHENAEVAIFDVPALSQILVVFRGDDEHQAKPVRAKDARYCKVTDNLHPDQKVTVFPSFLEAYNGLEAGISALVDKLSDANPFAKVVFCGNSFGGALATIAAVRYASNRPTMMVSAHAYGSPKVGALNFRQLAHSLANLKIIRVENTDDTWVNTPADNSSIKWDHVGHAITIGKSSVVAYRFDKNKPVSVANPFRKIERDSKAYCQSLESRVNDKQWVEEFRGEDVGDGVKGGDDEQRQMV
jgi:hypothetical protein